MIFIGFLKIFEKRICHYFINIVFLPILFCLHSICHQRTYTLISILSVADAHVKKKKTDLPPPRELFANAREDFIVREFAGPERVKLLSGSPNYHPTHNSSS